MRKPSSSSFISLIVRRCHLGSQGEPDESTLDRHGHYRSRDGSEVHRPAKTRDGGKPAGATAKCRDDTWSFSHTRRGTCSGHGGVARWEG